MRRFACVFAILLTANAASAFAQASAEKAAQTAAGKSTERPRLDVNLSAGFFEAQPEGASHTNYDDWYPEGRYAIGAGYYWTENFKTEIEFATTGEGSRYVQDFDSVPGSSQQYPYSYESFHRIQQTSVRAVWQFRENTWVHPYVNGGLVFESDRHRYHVPAQYRYPVDPRTGQPVVIRPASDSGKLTDHRGGVTFGGGAKFYMTPQTYINTGMQVTHANPSTTVSVLAGFGIDF
jgi:hypothetical protein